MYKRQQLELKLEIGKRYLSELMNFYSLMDIAFAKMDLSPVEQLMAGSVLTLANVSYLDKLRILGRHLIANTWTHK